MRFIQSRNCSHERLLHSLPMYMMSASRLSQNWYCQNGSISIRKQFVLLSERTDQIFIKIIICDFLFFVLIEPHHFFPQYRLQDEHFSVSDAVHFPTSCLYFPLLFSKWAFHVTHSSNFLTSSQNVFALLSRSQLYLFSPQTVVLLLKRTQRSQPWTLLAYSMASLWCFKLSEKSDFRSFRSLLQSSSLDRYYLFKSGVRGSCDIN